MRSAAFGASRTSIKDQPSQYDFIRFRAVKEKFPHTLLLFVTPPTAGELKSRLAGRGTETEDVIDFRMKRAKEEALGMDRYDYLLINDVVDECVEEMHQIIRGEHRRSFRNMAFIERMKEELKGE